MFLLLGSNVGIVKLRLVERPWRTVGGFSAEQVETSVDGGMIAGHSMRCRAAVSNVAESVLRDQYVVDLVPVWSITHVRDK